MTVLCINTPEGRAFKGDIYLDNVKQDYVVYCDDESGVIKRMVKDDVGRPAYDGDELIIETVHGSVRIAWKERTDD